MMCTNVGGMKILVMIVYAFNLASQRTQLWKEMIIISQEVNIPWIVMGDFNNDRLHVEKAGGRQLYIDVLSLFNTTIDENELIELPMVGDNLFTWHNEQKAEKRIACKLDRALVKVLWLNILPHVHVLVGAPGMSDHAPLKIDVL